MKGGEGGASQEAHLSPKPETRDQRLSRGIAGIIAAAAFASGIAAAIYFRDVVAIMLIGGGVFGGLAITYTILALLFVWPKLRWREFFGQVIDFLAF
jgi:hypothetical protein